MAWTEEQISTYQTMSARNKIIAYFNSREFVVYDKEGRPIDKEIEDFIYKINKRKGMRWTF